MFKNLPVPIMLVDKNFIIRYLNVASAELFGYEYMELKDKPVIKIIPETNRYNHEVMSKFYLDSIFPASISVNRDLPGLHKSGKVIMLRITIYSYNDMMCVVFTDVESTRPDMINAVKILNKRIEMLSEKTENMKTKLDAVV